MNYTPDQLKHTIPKQPVLPGKDKPQFEQDSEEDEPYGGDFRRSITGQPSAVMAQAQIATV
jgi:hypothetical protein